MESCQIVADRIDVLIADDDAPFRAALRSLLEGRGYRCGEAASGREALEVAGRRTPQCVLLDLGMPELDGFAVAPAPRANPATRDAHVHCVTGRTDLELRQNARAAGCERLLIKPVDPAALLRLVAKDLSSAEGVDQAGLTKSQAESLLDWLDANNYPPAEVICHDGTGFTVRCPAARDRN